MLTQYSKLFNWEICNTARAKLGACFQHPLVLAGSAILLMAGTSTAAPSGFTFTHIGVLPNEQGSEVVALNDMMTLAGCSSWHLEQDVHPYTRHNAARWTPGDGLKALPLLPFSTAAANGVRSTYVGGNDVTPDGKKLLFTSHTTPNDGAAAAICDADGSNVVVLTSLAGGAKLPSASQISDDGQTVFGRTRTADFFKYQASRWTSATGFQLLAQPAGYEASAPGRGAVSGDGTVSVGTMVTYDVNGNATAQQAYRWTTEGMKGIGYLPGDDQSQGWDVSADGSIILGMSSDSSAGTSSLFIWTAAEGMKNLRAPTETYSGSFFPWGYGLSGDGKVVAVAYKDFNPGNCGLLVCDYSREYVSFVMNPAYGYYLDLIEAIKRAGGGSAIKGWTNFTVNGITDDGNTVYGYAFSPQNVSEGFMAHFPAGFLQNLKSPERLLNISTRLQVGTGEKIPIAGFIVTGGVPKKVIVRGLGPSLASAGVGAIADPILELHKPDGTIVTNDEWKSTQQAQIEATGIAPQNDHEAAIIARLAPGFYSAVLRNRAEASGVGLVEVYDLNPAADSKLANISTRGFVGTGDNVMIAGFIVGKENTNLLLRAIGPSLSAAGITNPLMDPQIEIRDKNGTLFWSNDNWNQKDQSPYQVERIKQTGLAPTDEREAAIVMSSQPDNWTAIVRGKDNATGVALVEVYNLGP